MGRTSERVGSAALTGALLVLASAACGRRAPAEPTPRPAAEKLQQRTQTRRGTPESHAAPIDPPSQHTKRADTASNPASTTSNDAPSADEDDDACQILGPVPLPLTTGLTSTAASESALLVGVVGPSNVDQPEAEVREESIQVFSLSEDAGSLSVAQRARLRLPAREFSWERGAPAVLINNDHAFVAAVAMTGQVVVAKIMLEEHSESSSAGELPLVAIAAPADRRFPPALSALGQRFLLAYVKMGRVMRVRLLTISSDLEVVAAHEVTPEGMGASAPVFVKVPSTSATDSGLRLLITDAREGFSPIVQIPIATDGTPRESSVLRTVGTLTMPPQLAALQLQGRIAVAYTAVGGAAATAVGLVFSEDDKAPAPLVPSFGYGRLSVSAAGSVFAVSVATGSPRDAPRKVQLKQLRHGTPRVVGEFEAPAFRPSISDAGSSRYLLSYSTGHGARASMLRCEAPSEHRSAADQAPEASAAGSATE